MPVNRVVALVTVIVGLVGAVAPALANMDWTSTAGIASGLVVVLGVALKFLEGSQKHEERQFLLSQPPDSRDFPVH